MRYISKEFEIVFVHLCIPNVYFHQLKYTTILNVLGYVFVKRHGMCFLLYVSHILLILVYVHLNACYTDMYFETHISTFFFFTIRVVNISSKDTQAKPF